MPKSRMEKRRFPRIASEHALIVTRVPPGEGEGFAKTRVVGLGGCMFVSDEPMGDGALLDLLISMRGRVVKARGRVVYEIPQDDGSIGVGVEFVNIEPYDREVIAALFVDAPTATAG